MTSIGKTGKRKEEREGGRESLTFGAQKVVHHKITCDRVAFEQEVKQVRNLRQNRDRNEGIDENGRKKKVL